MWLTWVFVDILTLSCQFEAIMWICNFHLWNDILKVSSSKNLIHKLTGSRHQLWRIHDEFSLPDSCLFYFSSCSFSNKNNQIYLLFVSIILWPCLSKIWKPSQINKTSADRYANRIWYAAWRRRLTSHHRPRVRNRL